MRTVFSGNPTDYDGLTLKGKLRLELGKMKMDAMERKRLMNLIRKDAIRAIVQMQALRGEGK